MAEDFQAGICGENWWSSSRSVLVAVGGLSPCSAGIGDLGSYGWPPTDDFLGIKAKSSSESNSISDNSMLFQDTPKAQNSDSASGGANSLLMDSGLQMMGFALSSSATSDWNQTDFLCGGGRGESTFNSNGIQTYNDQIRKDWSPTNFSAGIGNDSSSINTFKQTAAAAADHDYFLDQNRLNSINCSSTSTPTSTPTCQGLSSAGCFPLDSTLYGYPSKLLQSLYDPGPHQPQQPLFNSRSINSNSFGTNPNDLSLSSPNFPSYLKPSLPKQPQPVSAGLHFTNNTPYWNASAAASTDIRQGLVSSSQTPVLASILEDKNPKCQNTPALKPNGEDGQEPMKSDKNSTTDPVFKRPRIETPSPLPTFKVRKEKLGDRVTALQQLVSPFGKTDTASVLHEAIEYIKFLHDQVSVLSTPYLKNNNGTPVQPQQVSEKANPDCPKQDLRSRGLCLVPISSTFPVTNATTSDFWTPTFGGTFR